MPWDGSGERGVGWVSGAGDEVEHHAFHSLSMDSVGQDEEVPYKMNTQIHCVLMRMQSKIERNS